jgi:3-phosphoinositide dependent protein kinase-1
MVGTEEYIAPEILEGLASGPPADLWSLGVIVFMMLSGKSPFKTQSQIKTFEKIQNVDFKFPEGNPNFTENAKDLINKLLVKDPSERLGAGKEGMDNDYYALKAHPYF